jgi:hypothetical protein
MVESRHLPTQLENSVLSGDEIWKNTCAPAYTKMPPITAAFGID